MKTVWPITYIILYIRISGGIEAQVRWKGKPLTNTIDQLFPVPNSITMVIVAIIRRPFKGPVTMALIA